MEAVEVEKRIAPQTTLKMKFNCISLRLDQKTYFFCSTLIADVQARARGSKNIFRSNKTESTQKTKIMH